MAMEQVRAGLGMGLYKGRCWLYRALFFHQCFWSVPSNSLAGSIFFPASQLTCARSLHWPQRSHLHFCPFFHENGGVWEEE